MFYDTFTLNNTFQKISKNFSPNDYFITFKSINFHKLSRVYIFAIAMCIITLKIESMKIICRDIFKISIIRNTKYLMYDTR